MLDLEFRNGTRYRYFRVPREIYQGLLESESKGQYFNQHIRNCFPTVQLHFNGKLMVMTRARTAGHRS